MDRNRDVKGLFDLAIAYANEMLSDNTIVLDAESIFNLACEVAINEYVPEKNVNLPVGRVDLTRVAFDLQDEDSVSMIVGDQEFADNMDKTVYTWVPAPEEENE